MSHILIQNQGELPVWGIRLLGWSDKTSDKIGRFGTGLKESIALLARIDCLPVIFTGTLCVNFSVQTIDGQAEICFKLSEDRDRFKANTWIGLGLHPNFGAADWTDPWQAFREIVCNAQDAGGLFHDVDSREPSGVAGSTRVYVPVNSKTITAYGQLENRLLFLRSRDVVQDAGYHGMALKKSSEQKLQIYHKGVWVQEHKKESLFDYELPSITLNESRSSDWWGIQYAISGIIAKYTKDQVAAVFKAIANGTNFYERDLLCNASERIDLENSHWLEAFLAIHGENAVLTTNDAHFFDRLRARGYHPVVATDDGLHQLLLRAGCPNAMGTLTRDEKEFQRLIEPGEKTQDTFDVVWKHAESLGMTGNKKKPSVMIFQPRPGATELTLGSYDNGVCFINIEAVGSELETMACVEEIAHHISGCHDMSREFQTFLVKMTSRSLACLK
jgi:hypothetical protein